MGFWTIRVVVKRKNKFIEAIWLSDSPVFPQLKTSTHLTKAIFNISKLYSLILIDWNKEIICRIRSESDVREYLYQNSSFDYWDIIWWYLLTHPYQIFIITVKQNSIFLLFCYHTPGIQRYTKFPSLFTSVDFSCPLNTYL